MSAAPWPVPEGRIKAMAMDMRDLKFNDASFDFAWSTGAFEHIGEDKDFAAHLGEVHRVLKPGGVYAFTTVVTFGNESERIPHNYYFHTVHLFDLVDKSPLAAAEEFDCRINDHLLNRPLLEACQDFGFEAANVMISPLISFRRGILTAANLVVLTKDPTAKRSKTAIIGFEETRKKLTAQAGTLTRRIWQAPQMINVAKSKARVRSQESRWHYFGQGSFKLYVLISRHSEAEKPAKVSGKMASQTLDSTMKIFTRERIYPHKERLEEVIELPTVGSVEIILKSSNENLHRFRFDGAGDNDLVILRAVEALD
jgi:SAM-dependent methyltransferase